MAGPKAPHYLHVQKYSVWNKKLNVDWKSMFRGLTRVAAAAILPTPNTLTAVSGGAEAFTSISLQDKPEMVAYQLIFTALREGLMDLVNDNNNVIHYESSVYQDLLDELDRMYEVGDDQVYDEGGYWDIAYDAFLDERDETLKRFEVEIDDKELKIDLCFLRNPRSLPLLDDFKPVFKGWLMQVQNLSEHAAESLANRFPAYFVLKVHATWRSNPAYYNQIEEALDLPTAAAVEKEIARIQYHSYLQSFPDQAVFDEAFAIKDVYIPLRGYWEEKKTEKNKDKPRIQVFDAEEHIMQWVRDEKTNQSFMVLKGGPGSGKSVLARKISANVAELNSHFVYHISMHLFMLNSSVQDGIRDFISRNDFLYHEDPFDRDQAEGQEKILFVFDGLDELAKAGAVSLELARKFVGELEHLIRVQNGSRERIKVLITGRDLVIQQNESGFDKPGQVIRLMPYHPAELDIGEGRVSKGKGLFKEDQRPEWWEKYWRAKGQEGKKMPEILADDPGKDLLSISSEPLLNYLLARAYEGDAEILSEGRNLNTVYQTLILGVYERKHSGERRHIQLSEEDFQRMLGEIAIAAWHGGDVRAVSHSRIRERCVKNDLEHLLNQFGGMQREGFMKLLVSFFFHQKGREANSGEETFEFTHKSFGEYLAAVRIAEEMEYIHEEYRRGKSNSRVRFGAEEALTWWMELCGPTEVGANIFNFLIREIALKEDQHDLEAWQRSFVELINYLLREGWAIPGVVKNRLREANRMSRNAEEALLLSLSCIARVTGKVSEVDWTRKSRAGQWLSFLYGQPHAEGAIVLQGLVGLNLAGQNLAYRFLRFANLQGAEFRGAILHGAILRGANLKGTALQGAILQEAFLRGAILQEANLHGSILRRADLWGANLQRADLGGVDLWEANLRGANLRGADLGEADLQGADLAGANLWEANLNVCLLDRYTRISKSVLETLKIRRAFVGGEPLEGDELHVFLESIAFDDGL